MLNFTRSLQGSLFGLEGQIAIYLIIYAFLLNFYAFYAYLRIIVDALHIFMTTLPPLTRPLEAIRALLDLKANEEQSSRDDHPGSRDDHSITGKSSYQKYILKNEKLYILLEF